MTPLNQTSTYNTCVPRNLPEIIDLSYVSSFLVFQRQISEIGSWTQYWHQKPPHNSNSNVTASFWWLPFEVVYPSDREENFIMKKDILSYTTYIDVKREADKSFSCKCLSNASRIFNLLKSRQPVKRCYIYFSVSGFYEVFQLSHFRSYCQEYDLQNSALRCLKKCEIWCLAERSIYVYTAKKHDNQVDASFLKRNYVSVITHWFLIVSKS